MPINRRGFLVLGGGLIASATMAEASALSEYLDWMKRKPVFSFAPYRPVDGPELFVVNRVVKGIPVAFTGPLFPLTASDIIGDMELRLRLNPSLIDGTHRKRPIAGWVRGGDVLDYYDLRTMPPPSKSAQQNSDEMSESILSAYDAECSGDKAKIAASMRGYIGPDAWSAR